MSDRVVADVWWDRLGWDLTAVILCKLPLRSMVRASAVCKAWRAVLLQLFQQQQKKKPWLFLRGQNNVVPSLGRSAFAYDPSDDSDEWVSFNLPPDCFAGAGGIAFAFDSASASLTLAPLLLGSSHYYCDSQIAMASSLRNCNPVVACSSGCRLLRLVVVGGAGFAGGLVDMDEEEDPLPTELLEADGDGYYWRREQCAPLPPELSSSSELRSSAMVEGRFLFVCGAYSCTVAAFDLSRRAWTAPLQLRPATGLAAAFLTSGPGGHRLVLAGLVEEEGPAAVAFRLWDVDPRTLAPTRIIGDMPPDLLASFGTDGSLRCVGEDGMLYIISDDRHTGYPACACDIILIGGEGEGQHLSCSSWRRLPPLPPEVISRFHKMVAFTSPVLHHHLPNK